MRVLVGYTTAFGSTRGVAERIAETIQLRGIVAEARPLSEVTDVTPYEAFVLGSPIHSQRWLEDAVAFLVEHQSDLRNRPLWLFSVGSVGESSSFFRRPVDGLFRRMQTETKQVKKFKRVLNAREHRIFAGAIERDSWPLAGHLFLKLFGGRYGDHRDWPDIESWANRIATDLEGG
jgi:menaquinone-dependent protoporphyrinogen oxidase